MASCRKTYNCECSTTIFTTTVTVKSEAKSTKKAAKEWCDSMGNPSTTVDGVSSANLAMSCELK